MYKKSSSILINLLFGIGLSFLLAYVILAAGGFQCETEDNIFMICCTVVWIIGCLTYNIKRYHKLKDGELNYSRAAYYLTLFLPLLSIVIVTMIWFLVDKIRYPWKW